MTIYVENETDFTFPFDTKELCSRVAEAVLDAEGCPYETEINVLITDNEGIRLYNKESVSYTHLTLPTKRIV